MLTLASFCYILILFAFIYILLWTIFVAGNLVNIDICYEIKQSKAHSYL